MWARSRGRFSWFLLFAAVGGASGCGLITGLTQYSNGNGTGGADGTVDPHPGQDAGRDAGSSSVDAPVGQSNDAMREVIDEGVVTDASVDADPDGTGQAEAGEAGTFDEGGPGDAEPEATSGDGGLDARPVCGPSTCGGCCDANGACVGGQSTGTCGTGGAVCRDCASVGQSCNAGSCSAQASDAGPMCTAQNLGRCAAYPLCIPAYQFQCCKTSDGTCGCKVNFPPGPCL